VGIVVKVDADIVLGSIKKSLKTPTKAIILKKNP
jgi:glycine/serine hydroxymethyltransferase